LLPDQPNAIRQQKAQEPLSFRLFAFHPLLLPPTRVRFGEFASRNLAPYPDLPLALHDWSGSLIGQDSPSGIP
jgi:hypothetical protein